MEEMRMINKIKAEHDLYLKKLLKLVKSKGILVKKMNKGDSFLFVKPPNDKYKKNLGAVPVKGILSKKIKHVYVVYEDFDGSIKYYDYPQL